MGLQYLPGVEMDDDKVLEKVTAVGVVEDYEQPDEDEEEDPRDEEGPVLVIDKEMIDTIGIVVAEVIIKNMDNLEDIQENEPERIAWIAEEVETAIGELLDFCDFSWDAYEQWQHVNMIIH